MSKVLTLCRLNGCEGGLGSLHLVDISKLGLNSKIKKFSYSFICGKGLFSPPEGGRIAFCLQSEPETLEFPAEGIRQRLNPSRLNPNIAHRLAFVKQIVFFDKMTVYNFVFFVC